MELQRGLQKVAFSKNGRRTGRCYGSVEIVRLPLHPHSALLIFRFHSGIRQKCPLVCGLPVAPVIVIHFINQFHDHRGHQGRARGQVVIGRILLLRL